MLRAARATYTTKLRDLKDKQKVDVKRYRAELKRLEKEIPVLEREAAMLSNRGRLTLMLAEEDAVKALRERWIAAEAAKRLDYPIFMAVSERGGKDNSGEYVYREDGAGHFVLDASGQKIIDQDLVNYELSPADLKDAAKIPDDKLCIAEAFVRFAQEQGFDFWRAE